MELSGNRKNVSFCILVCVVCILLAGCCDSDTGGEIANTGATNGELTEFGFDEAVFPFEAITDVSDSLLVTEGTEVFDESLDKYSLLCSDLLKSECSYSVDQFAIPDVGSNMAFQCTWTRSGLEVYVGLLNLDSECLYIIPLRSGSATGKLDLSSFPAGQYQCVLSSNNNQELFAVLAYQFY